MPEAAICVSIVLDKSTDPPIATEVTVEVGASLLSLKQKLAADDPTGTTKATEILLRLPERTEVLPDSTILSETHGVLELVDAADPSVDAESYPSPIPP
eukprot:2777374-Amphidinium_carterae.1